MLFWIKNEKKNDHDQDRQNLMHNANTPKKTKKKTGETGCETFRALHI